MIILGRGAHAVKLAGKLLGGGAMLSISVLELACMICVLLVVGGLVG